VGGHLRGLRNFGGVLQKFSGSLAANYKYIFGILSSSPVDWHPCWVLYLKGGVLVPGHRVAWNAPSRLRGCVQVNCQKLIPNLQFTYCIMQSYMNEVKKCFGNARFWLDMCTKQVVSVRACTHQFLPYNSSGIELSGMGTVQAYSCLGSEQINAIFISVGGHEGGLGGVGGHLRPEAQN